MKKLSVLVIATLSACSRQASVGSAPSTPQPVASAPAQSTTAPAVDVRATATINDGSGNKIGSATFSDTPAGLLVSVTVTGLGIGPHGAHLHTVGVCTGPTFTTAGGHFNPGGKSHGFRNNAGHHAGDMPNIVTPPAGPHTVQFIVDGVKLSGRGGLLDDDGASIVIHSGEDDYLTDPAGNSGGRFACGVISMTR